MPPTPLAGHPTDFLGQVVGGTGPFAWEWDFGDGITRTLPIPAASHVYTQAGAFDVNLTVSNACGLASHTETVTVDWPCEALDVTKTGPVTATQNSVVQMQIILSSTFVAPGTVMSDALPSGMEFAGNLAASAGNAWYSAVDNAVYWTTADPIPPARTAKPEGATFDVKVSDKDSYDMALDARTIQLVGPAVEALVESGVPVMPDAVMLWSQPITTADLGAYANQDFVDPANDPFDIFIADDFTNDETWRIDTIFVPGNLWNGGTTLMNANLLNWEIYADGGGMPDGDPSGGGNPPVWSLSVPPSNHQVILAQGVAGLPSNALVFPDDPIVLEPGTYWLVFYPSLEFAVGGQYGRHVSDTTNGYEAHGINPAGGFGFPTTWTPVISTPWALTWHDFAFSLMGGAVAPITVTFDVTITAQGGMSVTNTALVDYCGGLVSDDHIIDVFSAYRYIYLPIVFKTYGP